MFFVVENHNIMTQHCFGSYNQMKSLRKPLSQSNHYSSVFTKQARDQVNRIFVKLMLDVEKKRSINLVSLTVSLQCTLRSASKERGELSRAHRRRRPCGDRRWHKWCRCS